MGNGKCNLKVRNNKTKKQINKIKIKNIFIRIKNIFNFNFLYLFTLSFFNSDEQKDSTIS